MREHPHETLLTHYVLLVLVLSFFLPALVAEILNDRLLRRSRHFNFGCLLRVGISWLILLRILSGSRCTGFSILATPAIAVLGNDIRELLLVDEELLIIIC